MCKNSRWCSWPGDFVSSAFFADSAVNRNLKKQSQFLKGQNDAMQVMTMVYGDLTGRGGEKTKPIKANLYFTAENAECAEYLISKDSRVCIWLQTMKLQTLFPLRSPRTLRLKEKCQSKPAPSASSGQALSAVERANSGRIGW